MTSLEHHSREDLVNDVAYKFGGDYAALMIYDALLMGQLKHQTKTI
jgi:hypothetical protein